MIKSCVWNLLGLLATLVLGFVALWLAVPMKAVWSACFALGFGLNCAYALKGGWSWLQSYRQRKRQLATHHCMVEPVSPPVQTYALLIQAALCGLLLAFVLSPPSLWSWITGDLIPIAKFVVAGIAYTWILLFVLSVLALVVSGLLALKRNPMLSNTSVRALTGSGLAVACVATLWASLVPLLYEMGYTKTNLQTVNYFQQMGVQLFTPARYAQELLTTTYPWHNDPATPATKAKSLLSAFDEPSAYMKAHVHPDDSFSSAQVPTEQGVADEKEGNTRGFGLEIVTQALATTGTAVLNTAGARIRNVKQDSPAAAAGLQRGDSVVAVARQQAGQLVWQPWALLGSAGKKLDDFAAIKAKTAAGLEVTLEQANAYPSRGMQQVELLSKGIAYLRFDRFVVEDAEKPNDNATQSLNYTIEGQNLQLESITTLVIDLRNNTGSAGIGAARFAGQIEWPPTRPRKTAFGAIIGPIVKTYYAGGDSGYDYTRWPAEGSRARDASDTVSNLKSVLVLTGPESCAAAEQFVRGMRTHKPSLGVQTFGATTCGKQFGTRLINYFGTDFRVVTDVYVGNEKKPFYRTGIAPTCPVIDPISGLFAGQDDVVVQAALVFSRTGRCPAAPLPITTVEANTTNKGK